MNLYEICFSPTGGTKKAADILTAGLSGDVLTVDLTDPHKDFSTVSPTREDVAVIAVPSYGGRVPAPAVHRIAAIRGSGARAILLCVYGNRAYEDTLAELQDTVQQAGFQVVAAVAAVAEHSIARQFAAGRPDEEDSRQLAQFAAQIQEKLKAGDLSQPAIPGNRPYKKAGGAGLVPKPTTACVSCGVCAQQCTVQAIDAQHPGQVDGKACISCMRCVSVCPHSARYIPALILSAAGLALKKVCSTRKTCELFLS